MAKVRKIKGREGYFLDYHMKDGTRVIRKTTRDNRRAAQKELALIVSEMETKPGLRRLKKITCGKMCDEYMETFSRVNHRSWRDQGYILNHAKGFFATDTWLVDISKRRVERFKAQRANEVKPATVNRNVAVLKHLFSMAVDWGYLYENPTQNVKLLHVNNRRLRYLEKEEIARLVAAASQSSKSHLKPIIILAINTGMRRGEIFDLQWIYIDLKNRFIEVIRAKNGDKRAIPINDTLLKTLHRLPRRVDSPYVFPGKNGGRLTDIKTSFLTARKKAGLDDVTLHTCRHTFASHLVMAGVDLMTVKELLGHKSIKMTERYSHLSPNHKATAVKSLDFLCKDATAQSQQGISNN